MVGKVGFELSTGFDGATGSGSLSSHHFLTPSITVQTRVFPLCVLTCLNPSSLFGQVRHGAACPSGYPSSVFAALDAGMDKTEATRTEITKVE